MPDALGPPRLIAVVRLKQMKAHLPIVCSVLCLIPSQQAVADSTNAPPLEGTNSLKRADSKERETQIWMHAYFRANGVSTSAVLRAGMKLDEFVKVLGEPTKRYKTQKGRIVEGKVEGQHEDWVEWHHSPLEMHAAPFIRVRIEDGHIKELVANQL